MAPARRDAGFTLLELMLVVVIFGIMAVLGSVALQDWVQNQRTREAAREVADLFMLARQEAVRTGDNHVVFLDQDANDLGLQTDEGRAVAALLIRDANADGAPQNGEYVASVPFDNTNSVGWGSVFALAPGSEVPAPNDNPAAAYPLADSCCSFTEPGGNPARWVVFLPDGTPRGFSMPFSAGAVGTGTGTVYLSSGSRDYAVVLTALGSVRVHAFNEGQGQWRQ
jgi:prepilin-type N-terminal cleavage/methylation domain-containing protein